MAKKCMPSYKETSDHNLMIALCTVMNCMIQMYYGESFYSLYLSRYTSQKIYDFDNSVKGRENVEMCKKQKLQWLHSNDGKCWNTTIFYFLKHHSRYVVYSLYWR